MHIRCPHCHNPVEVVGDDFSDVACPSCGSHFSLISGDTTTTIRGDQTRTIGHFELVHQVGVGAFGSAWKARDKELDRTVAIKIPRRDQLTGPEADAFLRGATSSTIVDQVYFFASWRKSKAPWSATANVSLRREGGATHRKSKALRACHAQAFCIAG